MNEATRNIVRPVFGTIMFIPFLIVWCLTTGQDLELFGWFTVYSTIAFVPIYWGYEKMEKKLTEHGNNTERQVSGVIRP